MPYGPDHDGIPVTGLLFGQGRGGDGKGEEKLTYQDGNDIAEGDEEAFLLCGSPHLLLPHLFLLLTVLSRKDLPSWKPLSLFYFALFLLLLLLPSLKGQRALLTLWKGRSPHHPLACRHLRALFWVYLPIVIALIFSTLYLRYHYLIDVMAGVIFAGFTLGLEGVIARWCRCGTSCTSSRPRPLSPFA
ncbi:MAG: hypothetical protein DRG36_03755 [Deltaproteobacteria bacterium]|nr:MAG: hypothetical protein DRG36_03755 [Deltaproteobacteria bacterium]